MTEFIFQPKEPNGTASVAFRRGLVYSFHGFVATPTHLYLVSVDDASGASLSVRATTNGVQWAQIFYTTSEGKNIFGRSAYFSQQDRAYFAAEWQGISRLVPIYAGQAEARFVTAHGFSSLIELDGRLFGIGGQSPANRGSSPYIISLLGNYNSVSPVEPTIITQPMNQSVTGGSTVTFDVSVAGTFPLFYQWRKNSTELSSATNSSLILTNVRRSDNGFYSVQVTNAIGSAISSNALLRVMVRQQFSEPPRRLGDGSFRLLFGDSDGGQLVTTNLAVFEIHVSTNLANTNWIVFTNGFTLTNGMIFFDDIDATNHQRRFYRVIER